jgi:hypothetical protein
VSQGTALGWTVVGSMPITLQPQPPNSFVIWEEVSLGQHFQCFWQIESIEDHLMSLEECACKQHFVDSTTRQADGTICQTANEDKS